jgi:hypothetical protein
LTLPREIPLTAGYAAILLAVDVVMALLPLSDKLAVAHTTSTNITHLAVDPLIVLPASAFVDVGNGWAWVPLSLLLLGGLERAIGARRALLVAFGAHVIATLLSEGLLLLQIAWHTRPSTELNVLDVGPSYVLLAALTGCLVVGGWRLRGAAVLAGVIVVPGLLSGLPSLEMSAVGHLLSLALGASFAAGIASSRRWQRFAGVRESPAHATAGVTASPATATGEALRPEATRVLEPAA